MSFFDLFKPKSGAPEPPQLIINADFKAAALSIAVDWRGGTPGDLSALEHMDAITLATVMGLASENRARKLDTYHFEIPFEEIPYLPAPHLNILNIEPQKGWQVDLRVRGIIGRGDPQVRLYFTSPDGEYDVLEKGLVDEVACGFRSTKTGELIVLPAPVLNLREKVSQGPDLLDDDAQAAVYRFLADVKKAALEVKELLGEESIEIDGQLLKENFIAADEVRPQLQWEEDGSLRIFPVVDGLDDPQKSAELLNAPEERELFSYRDKKGTARIALTPQSRREVTRIKRRHRVPAEDVPRFLRDPRNYLQPPEELEQERKELAKRLGIPVAQLEDLPDLDPDQALNLTPIEEILANFDLDEYSERVIGIDVRPGAEPQLQNIRSIKLDDWSGSGESKALPGKSSKSSEPREKEAAQPFERLKLITADNEDELDYLVELRTFLARRFEELGGTPEGFSKEYRLKGTFQPEGYAWLRGLTDSATNIGGLLADDMGMGKTVQIVALFAHLASENKLRPALIVAPKSTIPNWQNEIKKFCSLNLHIYEHLGQNRSRNFEYISDHDIVVTTYDTLRQDQILLGKIHFTVMVCDEAQMIKNYTSGRAAASRAMNADTRIALSATPVENTLSELWSIFDFCQPGKLHTLREFRDRYVTPIERGSKSDQETAARNLLVDMGHHFLRRTKEEYLADELPQKHIHRHELPMSSAQVAIYDEILGRYHENPKKNALPAVQSLLRVCTHPEALTEDIAENLEISLRPIREVLSDPVKMIAQSPKFEYILEKLQQIEAKEEKAILFAGSRTIQSMLSTMVKYYFGFHPPVINGDVDTTERQTIIDQFNSSPGFNIILLSPRAAGVGINVTGANHVFHVIREWNPAVENQATDRAYRIGQKKDVHVYIPVTIYPKTSPRSLDESLDQMLSAKQHIASTSIVPRGMGVVSQRDLEANLKTTATELV